MDKIKELWLSKHTPQGKIDITLFFVNIFLIITHIFLMIIYIVVDHKFMVCVNIASLLLYISFIFYCYKKPLRYAGIVFLEIWVHMLCAVASFGWEPCFQNWSFAIVSAYFFPAFGIDEKRRSYKTVLFYTGTVVITYFMIAILVQTTNLSITKQLDDTMNSVLFFVNNCITFFTIVMFAIFYTSNTQRRTRELTRKADYDELTNLYNRYALNQIYKNIGNADQVKNYSVAILDIDDFKKINDEYGHNSGDIVLIELANILKFYSIKGIKAGRWGGEEFVILAPSSIKYSEFVSILEKLRLKISRSKFKIEDEKEINVTVSIGSTKVKDAVSLADALTNADKNMYRAKITGKNKVIS